mgnify:CR=1 FL=1
MAPQQVKIYDARTLQAKYPSPGAFYKKFGFCLVKSPTKVKNWNENYLNPFTDITKIYHKEVIDIINEVYDIENPETDIDFNEISQNHAVLRRGPGSKNNFYAEGIHQDYGLEF